MNPAKEVGGDFYDCFYISDHQFCVLIGDVSGKGIAGALFMSMVRSLLHDRMKFGASPADALNQVNDELYSRNPEEMFVTVFALVMDTDTGIITYANAGHNPPLKISGLGAEYLEPASGIAIGLFEDADICNETLKLSSGDGIMLYTDGITEAVNPEKKFYGKERLLDIFKEALPQNSSSSVAMVSHSLNEYCKDCSQADDITIVSLFFCR